MKENGEPILILLALIVVIIITSTGNYKPQPQSQNTKDVSTITDDKSARTTPSSVYASDIYLSTGNASYSYQPYEEYITITNSGSKPINITGWQLKNGKDERTYDIGDQLRHFSADTVTIGQAALYLSPSGQNLMQNVVLKGGEQAIITTGQIGSQSPYKIVSFKENKCSGYLENMDEYNFTPSLYTDCPLPKDETGVSGLGAECRRFIERMSYCRVPEFNTRDSNGEICSNCVDDVPLSSSCVNYIKARFNYASCITNHRNDSDFSGRTWRIFLGKSWEMWATEYETIKLYDEKGKLVNVYSY